MKNRRFDRRKGKWVDVHHNWKLFEERQKGSASFNDFPLTIRIKPTTHPQRCGACLADFEKGEQQVLMESGMWHHSEGVKRHNGKPAFTSLHSTVIIKPTQSDGGHKQIIAPRKIYLHPHCFACVLNSLMRKAKLPSLQMELVCEKCDNRFSCFTGGMEGKWELGSHVDELRNV